MTVLVDNAYPSYWCTMRFEQTVTGTIPLRSQVNRVTVCAADCGNPANWVVVPYVKATDSFPYESGDADADYELEMQINPPASCGYQYDPAFHFGSRLTFHVLQGADQGATYQVRFDSEYWNYNEWSLANCVGFANSIRGPVDPVGDDPDPPSGGPGEPSGGRVPRAPTTGPERRREAEADPGGNGTRGQGASPATVGLPARGTRGHGRSEEGKR